MPKDSDIVEQISDTIRDKMLKTICQTGVSICEFPPCLCAVEITREVIAALEEAGWRVVPEKPTKIMVEAAHVVWRHHQDRRVRLGYGDLSFLGWETVYYQAMLDAAPKRILTKTI